MNRAYCQKDVCREVAFENFAKHFMAITSLMTVVKTYLKTEIIGNWAIDGSHSWRQET
jgi:hypothetical protein